jgi:hypothetical protein
LEEKILFIVSVPRQGKSPKFWNSQEHKSKFDVINQYALEDVEFDKYKAILVSMHIDQYVLSSMKPRLEKFLKDGKKLFFNGHIIKPFLDGLSEYIPMENPDLYDFKVKELASHPIFDGFEIERLNLRKGVAGFFGRGSNPAPKGAKILLGFRGGEVACDWEYMTPNGGILYVHSGNDLWMCFEEGSDLGDKMFTNIVKYLGE